MFFSSDKSDIKVKPIKFFSAGDPLFLIAKMRNDWNTDDTQSECNLKAKKGLLGKNYSFI